MNAKKKQETAAWTGGVIGFVLFLVVGLIPSLLFGQHGGKLIAGCVDASPLTEKILFSGGMVLGFAVGLFCFVLIGAVVAQGVCHLTYCNKRIDAELAANNGQLHPLPPSSTSSASADSAPSTSQDPKS